MIEGGHDHSSGGRLEGVQHYIQVVLSLAVVITLPHHLLAEEAGDIGEVRETRVGEEFVFLLIAKSVFDELWVSDQTC
jgi:hypothetical protein